MADPYRIQIEGYDGRVDELAESVARLKYEDVCVFLAVFARELERQEQRDRILGHRKLADELWKCALSIKSAWGHIQKACRLRELEEREKIE